MSDEGKNSHNSHPHLHHRREEEQQPPRYGTFQGVANYPQPVIGFPQPVPPPGATEAPPNYYAHGYQAVPVAGYAFTEGTPVRHGRLPCCGCGIGWFLFIIGFFLGAIPWYVAAFIFLCAKIDPREKPGYIACIIAAVLATIAIILGVTSHDW